MVAGTQIFISISYKYVHKHCARNKTSVGALWIDNGYLLCCTEDKTIPRF